MASLYNRPDAFAVEHEGSQAEILHVYASACWRGRYTNDLDLQDTGSLEWKLAYWKILEVLASADSRRNSELPQLGCVHFPRWQEETSRFERPQSPGSTYEENS